MFGCVHGTDAPPISAIPLCRRWIAFVFVVVGVGSLFVFVTVSAIRERWAAGMAAWPLGLPGHGDHLRAKQKPSEQFRLAPKAAFVFSCSLLIPQIAGEKQ